MKVSVIIPTYNHRQYVREALDSVFAQTFTEYEVIVVNDGSPDDTEEVLRPLVEAGRIRYVRQENAGQAAARNRGLAEADGDLVAFLDDDDLWPVDKLGWQVELLEQNPSAVLVYGRHQLVGADGSRTEDEPNQSSHKPRNDPYAAFRLQCWILSLGQTLIRTSALRAIGGFDAAIWGSDDWDMYIRLARTGQFLYSDCVSLLYRRHEGNASSSASLRHTLNHLKVVRRHIGLANVPLLVRHQRRAARYFVPRLLRYARSARDQLRYREAMTAQLCALSFRPSLLFRPAWLAPLLANVLHLPPRSPEQ